MDLELYDCGSCVGTLHMEKTGLYQTVRCSCRPESRGILRVYVWKGTEGACLGVLCPEGSDFTLYKRVSRAGLPFVPETAVIGCEEDGFQPWRGEFEGVWIDDGYLKKTEEGERLALPFVEGMEFPFVHRLSRSEEKTICGRSCIVLGPEEEVLPVEEDAPPPEEAAKPTEEPPEPEPENPPKEEAEEPHTRFHAEV